MAYAFIFYKKSKSGFLLFYFLTTNTMNEFEILSQFLKYPINTSEGIFTHFRRGLDDENIHYQFYGDELYTQNKNRFLYVPGQRKDRVVLVAHADTVRDQFYPDAPNLNGQIWEMIFENGKFKLVDQQNDELVLGADDRAGCAILWLLRNSGHSLLITDGEEKERIGSKFLMANHPEIADELNSHQFMVQFDRKNATDFKTYEVGTLEFRKYIETKTGFKHMTDGGYTDIVTLCTKICGVNFSVGYYYPHTSKETLVYSQWEATYKMAQKLLGINPLPRFIRK